MFLFGGNNENFYKKLYYESDAELNRSIRFPAKEVEIARFQVWVSIF